MRFQVVVACAQRSRDLRDCVKADCVLSAEDKTLFVKQQLPETENQQLSKSCVVRWLNDIFLI